MAYGSSTYGGVTYAGAPSTGTGLSASVHGFTTVSSGLNLDLEQLVGTTVVGKTTVTGSSTTLRDLAGTVNGQTSIANVLTVSILKGQAINGKTTVVAPLTLQSVFGGTAIGRTTISSQLTLALALAASVSGSTTIKNKLFFVFPEDFHGPITISGRSSISATLGELYKFSGSAAGQTRFTNAHLVLAIALKTGTIAGKTTVSAPVLRRGFEGDIHGHTLFNNLWLSINWPLAGAIAGHTSLTTALSLWHAVVHGKTTITPLLLELFRGLVASLRGQTQLRSLVVVDRSGRNPPVYTPFGFVDLTVLPLGDLGLPDVIQGATTIIVDTLTVDVPRMVIIFGNVGLEKAGSLAFPGSMSKGSEMRRRNVLLKHSDARLKNLVHYV